jgi:uncharacterized protein involved in outer membrane biogenesis
MKWRDIFGWVLAAVLAIVIIAVAGGYIFLKSNRFQQIAIHKITQAADQASGGKSEIRALDFSLRTLTVHLFDVKLHGTEQAAQPPLLQADNLTVGITIQSIWHKKFNLNELVIAHPVAYLRVDQSGKTNIPQPPPNNASGSQSIFGMAVGHFQIVDGEIYYNDKKIPLDADLHNLDLTSHFEPGTSSYKGTISYDNGRFHYAQLAAVGANFNSGERRGRCLDRNPESQRHRLQQSWNRWRL